ncbi:MAG: LysR family transcriptional regulator [Pseudolabrys sp.]|nr:LysR family transcriptional regulator [Pseudolabrys sp.]
MAIGNLRARHLSVFAAVTRSGSMQRAAVEVHLTQPAVSKLIAELEAMFGTPLFVRSKRGVSLTECGQALLAGAQTMLNDLADTEKTIAAIAAGLIGRIRIGVLPVAEARVLPSALLTLRRRAPGVRVRIEEGSRTFLLSALLRGELDCVIGRLHDHAAEDGIVHVPLLELPICVVCAPSHPLARARRVTFRDLATYPWILPQEGAPIRAIIDREFAAAGLAPPVPAVESTSIRLNHALTADTDLIGVMTADAALAYAKAGDLVRLPVAIGAPLPAVGIMLRKGTPSHALSLFMGILREGLLPRATKTSPAKNPAVSGGV